MNNQNGLGDVLTAPFSKKLQYAGGALVWYGWYLLFGWIWNKIYAAWQNRGLKEFYKNELPRIKGGNPAVDEKLPFIM
jgi:hypothetical protein